MQAPRKKWGVVSILVCLFHANDWGWTMIDSSSVEGFVATLLIRTRDVQACPKVHTKYERKQHDQFWCLIWIGVQHTKRARCIWTNFGERLKHFSLATWGSDQHEANDRLRTAFNFGEVLRRRLRTMTTILEMRTMDRPRTVHQIAVAAIVHSVERTMGYPTPKRTMRPRRMMRMRIKRTSRTKETPI